MPIIDWILYGDLKLDPICRSVTVVKQRVFNAANSMFETATQNLKQNDRRWRSFALRCQHVLDRRLPITP